VSLSPGTLVAHYRLIRQLGAGGMGEVYLAEDTRLHRQVAIKFLVAPSDQGARRRLLREARVAAGLEHPSIVSIYEIGSDPGGGDYIVMPYIAGETLAARIRGGPLSVDETLTLGGHIAAALSVAHRRGIVHRDLKPQNVMITPSGLPMLLDFGLAKHAAGSSAAADAPTASNVTEAHTVVGTSGYMSPEQLRGTQVDPRSDLFALGCVMYECLTGRRAFTGTSSADLLGRVLHVDPVTPSSIRPEATPADALCGRLLQKEPASRFQSADEVLGAIRVIQSARSGQTGTTPPSAVPAVRRSIAIAAAVVVMAAALFGVWQWRQPLGLPTPRPEVMRSYNLALEALREGSYQVAEGNLLEAVRLDGTFALAYVRLAEAYAELDRLPAAKDALVRVAPLVPNRNRLRSEDALRLRAVEAYVLREHDDAIAAYRELATRTPEDPRGWVDLARAEDNAGKRVDAQEHYEHARDLDRQYAPARMRLGTLLGQLGRTDEALAELDEAIRLYRTASNTEGLAEALVRKGTMLTYAMAPDKPARPVIDEAMAVAVGPRFSYPRVRAMFDLARLTSAGGDLDQAVGIAATAVDEARASGLGASASSGLREMGLTLQNRGRLDEAQRYLDEAVTVAQQHSAERAGMLARLQLAGLHNDQRRFQDALDTSADPLKYFTESSYPRNAAEAQVIRSRAYEGLGDLVEAERLTRSAMTLAESIGNLALAASSLENLVSQLEGLGQLPAALRDRERAEGIYRSQNNHASLAFSLVNHANLLSRLGRGTEALTFLDELERQIAAGADAYLSRKGPAAVARAFAATTTGRWDVAASAANSVLAEAREQGARPVSASVLLSAQLLGEHAAARLGRSRVAIATIAAWPGEGTSAGARRDAAYWAAQTLLLRKAAAEAAGVALAAMGDSGVAGRPDMEWQLASVAALALSHTDPARSATIRASANSALDTLRKTWDRESLALYLARADFAGFASR
jgi:tetratricopeptide (TPR) repeat protein